MTATTAASLSGPARMFTAVLTVADIGRVTVTGRELGRADIVVAGALVSGERDGRRDGGSTVAATRAAPADRPIASSSGDDSRASGKASSSPESEGLNS